MRNAVLAMILATALLSPAVAAAQSAPAGVKAANGVWTDPAGKPLYTYDNDTMKGMSHCESDCAKAWPPFLADPKAKAVGDWSLVTREGGAHQWAYKDKPLYTFPADRPGQAGGGESAGKFKLAKRG
jgi:predicted lipoprotein with Yx(FWY)xxD motif